MNESGVTRLFENSLRPPFRSVTKDLEKSFILQFGVGTELYVGTELPFAQVFLCIDKLRDVCLWENQGVICAVQK